MNTENVREEGVNVHLAQLLRNRGVSARAERRSREGAPDVRADLRSGDLVILECKWEESSGLLEGQLDGRLSDFPDALGLLGVLYPARLRQEEDTQAALGSADDLRWWVHGTRGKPLDDRHVRTGSVADIADNLRTLPLELEGVDRVAAADGAVGYALEQAAGQIGKHARVRRRIADIIADTDKEKDRAAALRIGCLVLFNALAFQDRLAAANEDVPTVRESLSRGITGLRQTWRDICDHIDYVPVFELAVDISHASTVYYTRQLVPFIAWVDRVYHGRRPEDLSSDPLECCGEWRRDKTEYKRWTGSSWKTVTTVGSGTYRVTGSPGNLSYYNLNNDVTLTGGAYVRQHLRYRNTVTFPVLGTYNFPGGWNTHFLE